MSLTNTGRESKYRVQILAFARGLLAMGLTSLLLYQIVLQSVKYFQGDTTLVSDYKSQEFLVFPTLVFCARGGTLKTQAPKYSREDYLKYHLKPQVEFKGMSFSENEYVDIPEDKMSQTYLPTIYNGLCKTFKFSVEQHERVWLHFMLNNSFTYDIFALGEGQEYFLLNQVFNEMPKTLSLSSAAQIELQPRLFKNRDTKKCRQYSGTDEVNCFKEAIDDYAGNVTQDCVSYPFEHLSNVFANRSCQDPQNPEITFMKILTRTSDVINRHKKYYNCLRPCEEKTFDTQCSWFDNELFFSEEGLFALFIYYPHSNIRVDTHYSLMDFISLTSTVGGLLGMYLGLSIFSIINKGLTLILAQAQTNVVTSFKA